MNRGLQYFNLIGVAALAILCVAQWRDNRGLNLSVNKLETVRNSQDLKLADEQRNGKGVSDDLSQIKQQLSEIHNDFDETRRKLRDSEQEKNAIASQLGQSIAQREQLRQSITNWTSAVAARDERLNEANERIRGIAGQLDEAVRKYNSLVTNYNAVVNDLNQSRSNYNSVVSELNKSRANK